MFGTLGRTEGEELVDAAVATLKENIITNTQILETEIRDFLNSDKRKEMVDGGRYYENDPDIRDKTRPDDIAWQANHKIAADFTKKLVDQKLGYLLTDPPIVSSEVEEYAEIVQGVVDSGFVRTLRNWGKEAINKGIAYLYPYINSTGKLAFKRFRSEQILPFWEDETHMRVKSFLRIYDVARYENNEKVTVTQVDYYHAQGITHYTYRNSKLEPDIARGENGSTAFYVAVTKPDGEEERFLWSNPVPIIHLKYNEEELPLIRSIKSLVDAYNHLVSASTDTLVDLPNFIYIIKNYDGADLGEFLKNINKYRAVKVSDNGGVDKLTNDTGAAAYETDVDRLRSLIYELGRGVDTRDASLRDASGLALQFRYSDLDMDCNVLESEFQSSLEHLLQYVNDVHNGKFDEALVKFTFKRNITVNEKEMASIAAESVGIISDETIREKHPWAASDEEDRMQKQVKAEEARFEQGQYSNFEEELEDE